VSAPEKEKPPQDEPEAVPIPYVVLAGGFLAMNLFQLVVGLIV
jgi:hypothetical protein